MFGLESMPQIKYECKKNTSVVDLSSATLVSSTTSLDVLILVPSAIPHLSTSLLSTQSLPSPIHKSHKPRHCPAADYADRRTGPKELPSLKIEK